eukprot:g17217.t1
MSVTRTSATVTSTSISGTTTSQTFTAVPGSCPVPALPMTVDISDCFGRFPGDTCQVVCAYGYSGLPAQYTCETSETFSGSAPTCLPTTTTTTATTTQTILVLCTEGIPNGVGVNAGDCLGLYNGQTCTATCTAPLEGGPADYVCDPSSGALIGPELICKPKECEVSQLPANLTTQDCVGKTAGTFCSSARPGSVPICEAKRCEVPATLIGNVTFSSSCDGTTHGQSCLSVCNAGYAGLPAQHLCNDGTLLGNPPSCSPEPCTFEGFPLSMGLDSTDCVGAVSGETCQVTCLQGYELQGSPVLTCLAATSTFSSSNASCEPAPCGNLSSVAAFASAGVGHSCDGSVFGEVCFAFCQQGYQLEGNASMLYCQDVQTGAGFLEGLEGQMLPAANSSGPSCTPKPCTAGIPSLRGVMHDCAGKATAETCILSAELGFTLSGPTTLTCQADGSFTQDPRRTPKPYRCQANATANAVQIEQLTDAILCDNSTNSTSNDTSSGRRLQSATCFAGSVQTVGLSVESFTHDCTGKVHDDACVAHCSLGWNMTETEPSIFLCDNGYLVGAALPTCTPLPCTFAFPNALGLLHTCDGVRTGETCLATCTEVGYDYSAGWAAETFTCLPTGSVTGQSPTCERISCQDLQLDARYAHNCQGLRYQDTCDVGCGQGYTLSGSSSRRQCEADGSFSGGLPTCVGNPCNMGLPNNPTVNASGCNGLTTGESCEVTCLPGFLLGNSSLTCHPSGYLLGVVPTCTPSPCPDIALPASLQSTCSGSTYGSKCAVMCAPGYAGSNGSSAIEDRFAAHTCDGIGFGAACFAFCDAGYESTGARSESWQCTGSSAGPTVPGAMEMQGVGLRGLALSCSPLPCIFNLPLGAQYAHNCSNVTTGSCADGFLGPSELLQCMPTRSLTGNPLPTCLAITSTVTMTSVTATSTTSVTTLPFLCTWELMPSIQGAGNFSCTGSSGVGQRCTASCEMEGAAGTSAAIVCWTNQMWQVEDVCISQPDGSRMMLFLGVTLGALCGLLLFACCAIACCFTRKSTLVQKLAVETSEGDDEKLRHSAESEAEPAEPQSYPWAARRWESTINLKDRAPLEWMSLEAASPSNWWPPTLPPQPAPPEAAQQSLSLIALDARHRQRSSPASPEGVASWMLAVLFQEPLRSDRSKWRGSILVLLCVRLSAQYCAYVPGGNGSTWSRSKWRVDGGILIRQVSDGICKTTTSTSSTSSSTSTSSRTSSSSTVSVTSTSSLSSTSSTQTTITSTSSTSSRTSTTSGTTTSISNTTTSSTETSTSSTFSTTTSSTSSTVERAWCRKLYGGVPVESEICQAGALDHDYCLAPEDLWDFGCSGRGSSAMCPRETETSGGGTCNRCATVVMEERGGGGDGAVM